jgi:hypothetical protein
MAISNGVIGVFLEGKKVVGEQGAKITVPAAAAAAPTQAEHNALRTALAAIVERLETHGLIAK